MDTSTASGTRSATTDSSDWSRRVCLWRPPLRLHPHLHRTRPRLHLHGHYPRSHGIISNDWYDRTSATRLLRSTILWKPSGFQMRYPAGHMSPHRMEATTIGDELKLAAACNPRWLASASRTGGHLPATLPTQRTGLRQRRRQIHHQHPVHGGRPPVGRQMEPRQVGSAKQPWAMNLSEDIVHSNQRTTRLNGHSERQQPPTPMTSRTQRGQRRL